MAAVGMLPMKEAPRASSKLPLEKVLVDSIASTVAETTSLPTALIDKTILPTLDPSLIRIPSLRPSRTLGDTCKIVTLEGGKKVNAWKCKDGNRNVLKWCGRCKWNNEKGRWTDGDQAHFTHKHCGWNPSANVVIESPGPNPPTDCPTKAPPVNPAGTSTEPSRTVSFSSSLSIYAAAVRGTAEE